MFSILSSVIGALFIWIMNVQARSHPHKQDYNDYTSLALPGEIPGGSPFRFCNESRDTDLYAINHIELYPQPLLV